MQGWISLHRSIQDHWIYEKRIFSKFEAWVDMLMLANHQDNKFLLGNDLISVERGQFVTSELKLMERWSWSKTKVRNFLKLLEEDNMIVKESDKKKTTLTICNYSVYQDSRTTEKPQEDHKKTTEEPQEDTNNNDNNDKNEYNIKYSLESEPRRLTDLLISKIKQNNEFARVPDTDKKIDDWCVHIDRLIRLDHAEPQVVANVINWCQSDEFWKNNILSTGKLREKFANLYGKYKAGKVQSKPQAKNNFHNFDQRQKYSNDELEKKLGIKKG